MPNLLRSTSGKISLKNSDKNLRLQNVYHSETKLSQTNEDFPEIQLNNFHTSIFPQNSRSDCKIIMETKIDEVDETSDSQNLIHSNTILNGENFHIKDFDIKNQLENSNSNSFNSQPKQNNCKTYAQTSIDKPLTSSFLGGNS